MGGSRNPMGSMGYTTMGFFVWLMSVPGVSPMHANTWKGHGTHRKFGVLCEVAQAPKSFPEIGQSQNVVPWGFDAKFP